MHDVFLAIQQTGLSIWMREDYYAYFIVLIGHAFGMALLIGGGIVFSLRVLGVGGEHGLEKLRGFFPVMWLGAILAVISGALLLIGYPAKALTNPMFAVKFGCLIAAAILLQRVNRDLQAAASQHVSSSRRMRWVAAASLVLWLGGVVAGKFLLHTYKILTV